MLEHESNRAERATAAPERSAPRERTRGPFVARLVPALLALWLAACVASPVDVHLAPFYTSLSKPGGGRDTELLLGAYIDQLPPPGAKGESGTRRFGLRPLWTRWIDERGVIRTHFLAPFGQAVRTELHTTSRLFPLYYYNEYLTKDGVQKWDFVALPGFFLSRTEGSSRWAWFPFYGNLKSFLAYDELTFVLFPLYMRVRNADEVTYNALFPIFAYSSGGGAHDWRVWPLYGKASIEKRYDRRFALWPFLHWHKNFLHGGRIEPESKFLFFPFYGRTQRGTYRSYTVLWPFFGYAHDPRADFWAVDAPFPFVRFQGGGKRPTAEMRSRVWPFYTHFRGDGLESRAYIWPIYHRRRELRSDWERNSTYLLPFLQSWRSVDKLTGQETSYLKMWPLYQREQGEDVQRVAFPDLNPLPHNLALDFHYGWLWEFARSETNEYGTSARSWGALWRREQDEVEQRTSLSGIYAHRTHEEDGKPASSYSLFLGLLRWTKVEGERRHLLRPAFPGPGWPPFEERAPRGRSAAANPPLPAEPDAAGDVTP